MKLLYEVVLRIGVCLPGMAAVRATVLDAKHVLLVLRRVNGETRLGHVKVSGSSVLSQAMSFA